MSIFSLSGSCARPPVAPAAPKLARLVPFSSWNVWEAWHGVMDVMEVGDVGDWIFTIFDNLCFSTFSHVDLASQTSILKFQPLIQRKAG